MKQYMAFSSSTHGQTPLVLSFGNNVTSMSQRDHSASFSSSHGIKRSYSQLIESNRSNEADESSSCSTDYDNLMRQLKQGNELIKALQDKIAMQDIKLEKKRAKHKNKDKNIALHFKYINNLEDECNEKSKKLAEKDALIDKLQLEIIARDKLFSTLSKQSNLAAINEAKLEDKIKRLEAENVEKDTQLQLKSATIDELQTQSGSKDSQLFEKERSIIKLQAECLEKANTIIELQARCNNKEKQPSEEVNLFEQCVKDAIGMQVNPEELKNLEKNLENVNSYFDTLVDRAGECCDKKQYVKAIMHYNNVIEFEQSTQNRSEELPDLFMYKAICHAELENHRKVVDATSSALQYNPNFKEALYSRAFAYFQLRQYSNARQDLENALELDSAYEKAKDLLEKVQARTSRAN